MKTILKAATIALIMCVMLMSGCIEHTDSEYTMEIARIELVSIEPEPEITVPTPEQKLRLVMPVDANFNLYGDDGTEYSATLRLREDSTMSMTMRSTEGYIRWYASWEDISINDEFKFYRIHGRDIVVGFTKDGIAAYKVGDDEFIIGRWSDSAMYE